MTDVITHFRIPIMSGQSTFTVQVPRHHLSDDRKFFFCHLNMVPDFFSLEAEQEKLDADPDMERMIEMPVQVKINYADPKKAYVPEGYNNTASTSTLAAAVVNINNYFEVQKPSFANSTPLFFDWVDTGLAKNADMSASVPQFAKMYYGRDFNALLHSDYAPGSARGIEHVNNFKPPIGTMPSTQTFNDRIRLRLWLGPYTKAVFSSKEPFATDFGFEEAQLGPFNKSLKQYHLVNDRPYWRAVAVAKRAPVVELTRPNFKINVHAISSTIEDPVKKIQMVKKDWLNNTALNKTLTELFKQASKNTNTKFSFDYVEGEKKFVFTYPTSPDVGVIIQCEPEFSHRLGFGLENVILKGMKALPREDAITIDNAQKKALTVVYDTGPIVCTLDEASSNTTSGATDLYMAALYPDPSGILSMPQSTSLWCSSNMASLRPFRQSSAYHVPVTFRLLRIYEDQSVSDFVWRCNAYIYGVLQGTSRKV